MPVRACLKNTGPGLCSFMHKAMNGMNGARHSSTASDTAMSNERFMNLLAGTMSGSSQLVNTVIPPTFSGLSMWPKLREMAGM